DQKIKESIENPSNVVPEDLAASNKYVLLVAGTYPLKISILEDKDGAAVWVPKSKAKEITDNGGSEKITFGFGDQVAEAWTRLITRYSSAEFKTNGWELVALKPYSAKEVKDAIAAIKTKSPEL